MAKGLFDITVRAVAKVLDLQMMKHTVLASNIANKDTPGYQAADIEFNAEVQKALERERTPLGRTRPASQYNRSDPLIEDVRATRVDRPMPLVGNDLNNVHLEKEMTEMVSNTLSYKANVQMISKKLAMLRYAITEGGR